MDNNTAQDTAMIIENSAINTGISYPAIKPEFAFLGKNGGTVDVVAGSPVAAAVASQILASLDHAGDIAMAAALSAAIASGANLGILGELSPVVAGCGAMAGVAGSFLKGSNNSRS